MPILENNPSIYQRSIRWDAHGCPPFKSGSDYSFLDRYKNSGVDFISLNVGFDLTSQIETMNVIDYVSQWVSSRSEKYSIVGDSGKILENKLNEKLSIAFDIEGCNLLNSNLSMIENLYEKGVRQISLVYNINNKFGGGCLDVDTGLTKLGREIIKRCNNVGMIIDCSHVGYQSSMEIMELSKHPVVFSHSNPSGLLMHPRNIFDKQIIACAALGGVVGINGIGIFLGDNDVRTERIVDHIDYVANLVGVDHVGIGLDCVFSLDEIENFVELNPAVFPSNYGFDNVNVAVPEQFTDIGCELKLRGYSFHEINKILGDNFFRVANTVWK